MPYITTLAAARRHGASAGQAIAEEKAFQEDAEFSNEYILFAARMAWAAHTEAEPPAWRVRALDGLELDQTTDDEILARVADVLERHPDGHYAKPEGGIWKPRKLKGHNKGDVYELRRLELASVAAYLDPHIRLYRVTRDGRKVARWPQGVLQAIVSDVAPASLPRLERIRSGLTARTDGQRPTAGYNDAESAWLPESAWHPLPDIEPAEALRGLQEEALAGFRFAQPGDQLRALEAILQGCLRASLGTLPMWCVAKDRTGAGGSALAYVIASAAQGVAPDKKSSSVVNMAEGFEEKYALSLMLAPAHPVLVLDDVTGHISSKGPLLTALASGTVTQRIPGTGEMLTAPLESLIVLTGNEPVTYQIDFQRRASVIRLLKDPAAQTERLHRTGIPFQEECAREAERWNDWVWTLIEDWRRKGQAWRVKLQDPDDLERATLEAAVVVRSILIHAGAAESHDAFREGLDAWRHTAFGVGAWRELLEALEARDAGTSMGRFRASDVAGWIVDGGLGPRKYDGLPPSKDRTFVTAIGHKLATWAEDPANELSAAKDRMGAVYWFQRGDVPAQPDDGAAASDEDRYGPPEGDKYRPGDPAFSIYRSVRSKGDTAPLRRMRLSVLARGLKKTGATAQQVAVVRGIDPDADKKAYDAAKRKLQVACPLDAAERPRLATERRIRPTGLVFLEWDKVGDVAAVRRALHAHRACVLVWQSAGGRGLHSLWRDDEVLAIRDKAAFSAHVKRRHEWATDHLPPGIDPAPLDSSRALFLSHDPDALYRPLLECAAMEPLPPEPEPRPADAGHEDDPDRDRELVRAALPFINSAPRSDWLDVGMALQSLGFSLDVFDAWSSSAANYEAAACAQLWKTDAAKPPLARGEAVAHIVAKAQAAGFDAKKWHSEWRNRP